VRRDGFWGLLEVGVFIICGTFDTEGLGLGLGIQWEFLVDSIEMKRRRKKTWGL
jgi:hypothetical protein